MKAGKTAEAGVAFEPRSMSNPPTPPGAFDLGVCFAALNRPPMPFPLMKAPCSSAWRPDIRRNKLYANLGQAYVACGQMEKAVACLRVDYRR